MEETLGECSLGGWAANEVSATPSVAALVAEYSALLYRVAFSILRNPAEAEDCVQETFLRVLEKETQLSGIREVRPWLVRITWNLALDRRRRIRPEQMEEATALALVAPYRPVDEVIEQARAFAEVVFHVDRLPAKEREVLLLAAFDELSHAEIAAVVGRSESSVRSLVFRARSHLQERLQRAQQQRTTSRRGETR